MESVPLALGGNPERPPELPAKQGADAVMPLCPALDEPQKKKAQGADLACSAVSSGSVGFIQVLECINCCLLHVESVV